MATKGDLNLLSELRSKHDTWNTLKQMAGVWGPEIFKQVLAKLFTNYCKVNEASINFIEGPKIGSFKFHITNREQIKLQSEMTDNYIDNNCPIQDHIVKKPIEITLTGLVGRYYHDISKDIARDVTYYRNFDLVPQLIPRFNVGVNLLRKTRQTVSKLTGSNSIVNRIVNSFISYGYGWVRDKLTDIANDYLNIYKKSIKVEDAQTDAFLYLEQLWQLSLPVTVQTSWKTYTNMYITSLTPNKEEDADITEFTVTFKQLSKISSIVVNTQDKIVGGNREAQSQEVSNNGETTGTQVNLSTLKLKYTNEVPQIIKVK